MTAKKLVFAFLILIILSSTIFMEMTSASSLNLIVIPQKQVYNVGEIVRINGNLSLDDEPVSDALVAVEVDNPKGDLFILRTFDTGSIDPNQTWPIEIEELFPCDSGGTPKYTFQPGGNAGFYIKVKNKAGYSFDIVVILSIVYSNKAPFTTVFMCNTSISVGQSIAITRWPVPIPESPNVVPGNTTVYANIYNVLPKNIGFAYCPEESTSFLIGSDGQSGSTPSSSSQFTLEIALSQITIWLGNYTVYATVKYTVLVDSSLSTFEVILVGDLYPDGVIDMRDIAIVARAFGTKEGDPNWNPDADLTGPEYLVPDGEVDMRDVAMVARAFGTEALFDP